jgi:dolichyl-diphosphooligosaccharide--protein glycosyltransferase
MLLRAGAPDLFLSLFEQISRLTTPTDMLVKEAMPLFRSDVSWQMQLFSSFGLAFPVALIGLLLAMRDQRGSVGMGLLVVWFVVSALAMIGQVRFGYYVTVPVAIFAAYSCDRLLERWSRRQELCYLLIAIVLFVPCAQLARAQVEFSVGPSDDWHEALTWMRENTPEPLGHAGAYFESYAGLSEAQPYPFPATAYGTLSWWDPGYWIIRIARRIPNSNPTQAGLREAALFFLATDENTATESLDRLGSRYVIASSQMPAPMGMIDLSSPSYFMAMLAGADENVDEYFQTFIEQRANGTAIVRTLYYPKYYQTMVTRLYAYGGRSAQPRDSSFVAVFGEQQSASGETYKALKSLQPASTYEEAMQMVQQHPEGYARVVGLDPLKTSVPLESLESLVRVHESPTRDPRGRTGDNSGPALVQIFEYRPDG